MLRLKEAAERAGVSERSVIRYAQRGELTVTYRKRPDGRRESLYDPAELDTVRERIEAEQGAPRKPPAASDSQAGALARVSKGELLAVLREAVAPPPAAALPSELAHKLTLTLAEAECYSGLGTETLKAAIAAGKLRARKAGAKREDDRERVVLREQLEAYTRALFAPRKKGRRGAR